MRQAQCIPSRSSFTLKTLGGRQRTRRLMHLRRLLFEGLEQRELLTTWSVLNTLDSGTGSLRQAIIDANGSIGPDVITFNIPVSGVQTIQTIQPLTALPTITDPVTIDGYSQPGSSFNTLAGPNNAVLKIELDGSLAGSSAGLLITAGGSTVRGLIINRFSRDGIQLEKKGHNVIEGNFIGTDSTGRLELGNGSGGVGEGSSGFNGAGNGGADYFGILVGSRVSTLDQTYGSDLNRIGTNGDGAFDAAERNLISGNDGGEIAIVGVGSDSNVVAGNLMGTDATGTISLSVNNGSVGEGIGILISSGSQFNRIGTDANGVSDAMERNVISGHNGSATTADQHTRSVAVVLQGSGTQNNVLAGNYIGTDVNGTSMIANGTGVKLMEATRNRIGTDSNGSYDNEERNIISGNGIAISMDGALNNLVAGNFIGTDVTGMTALPNGPLQNGTNTGAITLTNSLNNTIGGPLPSARNLISGNQTAGIFIQTSVSPTGNSIQGNFIGTDITGKQPMGNAGHGVMIAGGGAGPSNNSIAGNVISANKMSGIWIQGFQNSVQGNFIGTDITGTVDLGNLNHGVLVEVSDVNHTASKNLIGGATPAARNIISGNQLAGVKIAGQGSTSNRVQGNYIGTDITGNNALGNSSDGVLVESSASSNTIGGISSGEGNVISSNAGVGVRILSGAGNSIRKNAISANGGLGIDLGPNGVTANDLGDPDIGANNLQNFPVLASIVSSASNTIVQGNLNSLPNSSFELDFFANSASDPSGFGEGQRFIGSGMVATDVSGSASFTFTFPTAVAVDQLISSTATLMVAADANPATPRISSDTSEFSRLSSVNPYVPATISGIKYNDLNGNGIRDAITVASAPILVPGTADPWLAGMPNGSTASGLPGDPSAGHDVAPNQSPVLALSSLQPGSVLTFNVTGSVDHCGGGCPGATPDGTVPTPHFAGAENGISNITVPVDALVGVFLGANQPNLSTAPGTLDFSSPTSRDFLTLSPLLQQTFFIGDGRTSLNQVQQVVAPAGATRLFFGTMDGFGWFNNTGTLSVTVNSFSQEPSLSNWTVELDAGADGTVDDTKITDANGNYAFTGLEPNTYRVREIPQSGWLQTSQQPADILVSASGQSFTEINFGNHQTPPAPLATISGQKFEDHDGDGTQDPEEQGVSGWTIFLDNGNGTLDAGERSTITDSVGKYTFANVQPGTYQVREVAQAGWLQTTPIASVSASAGASIIADLGNFHLITVSGQKFEDHDANGIKDSEDQGLSGWTAVLYRWNTDHFQGIATTLTDSSGNYAFADVGPGQWAVDEVPQSGWTRTNAYPQFYPRSGENLSGKNLANFRGITVTGHKFEDHNGNGFQDPEDQPIAGWPIFIDYSRNGAADENEPVFYTKPVG